MADRAKSPCSLFLYRSLLCLALLAGGLASERLPAQEQGENDQTSRELQAIRRDIAELRKAVEELSRVVRQQQSASEFSLVRIYVEAEDGRPLAGFDVELISDDNEGRRVRATGTSNDDGLALARQLPYGDYDLRLSEPSGWSASLVTVTIELGRPLKLHVRAPDPAQQGTIVVHSALDPGGLADLHFGERRQHGRQSRFSGYHVPFTPEPMDEPGDFASFPTLDNGIEAVALQLEMSAERQIEQPDGDGLTWRWRLPDTVRDATLLVRSDGAARIVAADTDGKFPVGSGGFFVAEEDDEKDHVSVGYVELATKPAPAVQVPAGEVSIVIERLLGRANEGVLAALDLTPADNRQIWLQARLRADSAWMPRVLALTDWRRPEDEHPVHPDLARRTLTIESGQSKRLTLKSP